MLIVIKIPKIKEFDNVIIAEFENIRLDISNKNPANLTTEIRFYESPSGPHSAAYYSKVSSVFVDSEQTDFIVTVDAEVIAHGGNGKTIEEKEELIRRLLLKWIKSLELLDDQENRFIPKLS